MVKHGPESCAVADETNPSKEPSQEEAKSDEKVNLVDIGEITEHLPEAMFLISASKGSGKEKIAAESRLNVLVARCYVPNLDITQLNQELDILNMYIGLIEAQVTIKPAPGKTLLTSQWRINKQTKKTEPKGSDELKEGEEFSGDYFEWSKRDNLIYLRDQSVEEGIDPFRKVRLSMTDSTRDYLVVSVKLPVTEQNTEQP